MHVGIAYLRWRGKRSRHSRRMRTCNFAYLARGPWPPWYFSSYWCTLQYIVANECFTAPTRHIGPRLYWPPDLLHYMFRLHVLLWKSKNSFGMISQTGISYMLHLRYRCANLKKKYILSKFGDGHRHDHTIGRFVAKHGMVHCTLQMDIAYSKFNITHHIWHLMKCICLRLRY